MVIVEVQPATDEESLHPAAATRATIRSIPPARRDLRAWWDRWYAHVLWLQLWFLLSAGTTAEEPSMGRGWPERMAAIGHGLMLAGATLLIFALRKHR